MTSRALPVVVVLALAAGAAFWLLRNGDDQASSGGEVGGDDPPAGAAPSKQTGGIGDRSGRPGAVGADEASRRQRPSLPGAGAEPAVPRFEDEPRDPAWARGAAREVERVARAALAAEQLTGVVRIENVDCRSRRCQFRMDVVDADRFAEALAVLEDQRGFQSVAHKMRLHDMERGPDGKPTGLSVTLVMQPAEPAEVVPD